MERRESHQMSRRDLLCAAGGAAVGAAAAAGSGQAAKAADKDLSYTAKGNIRQSASRWCYRMPLEKLCAEGKKMGLEAIDLIGPGKDFKTLKKHGLSCSMVNSHGIHPGLNDKKQHARCLAAIRKSIEAAAEAGFANVITLSGNRSKEITDEEGLDNCAEAIKQVIGLAEKKKITLCMELLNSKRDHKGYMCDRTAWGVKLCKKVGSQRLKLLYDIYHMQIDEGDVIATIRESKDYIGHYHTGGVPGRNEIDETQELYYPAIMKAIVKTGYKGYVAHEFIPKRDPLTSLAAAIKICDV
ncbi:MAG TPA: TIM barrel protein [Phycisphaerae bacterium]|nr:TIM barrel protein [Phycisphaerae bacterium]